MTGALYSEVAILGSSRPLVLTLGLGDTQPLAEGTEFGVRHPRSTEEALAILEREEVGVVVLGPRIDTAGTREILGRIVPKAPNPLTIVVGFGREPEPLQEFVDSGHLFYVSRGYLTATELDALVTAAVQQYIRRHQGERLLGSSDAGMERAVEYAIRLLNQVDPKAICGLLVEAVSTVVGAKSIQCLFYDRERETLSSLVNGGERIDSAASGIVAFTARTGLLVELERIDTDPRYDPETDNPGGTADDCLVALPILGQKGVATAVFVATRGVDAQPFSRDDMTTIQFLLDCASSPLCLALLKRRFECLLVPPQAHEVFRREALDYHTAGPDVEGDLIQTPPGWLKKAHWLVVVLLAAGLVFLVVARVKEKAAGIAVIRARSKITLAAPTNGLVRSLEVAAGDRVRRGDLLMRFHELRYTTGADQVPEQLRATDDGVIGDVLVRAGQQVSSGDPVATIIDPNAGYELIVLLPGQYAPQLRRGMMGTFTVDGYSDSNEMIEIDDVGSGIVGAHEAARYAGLTDAVAVSGSIVVVRCHLQSGQFTGGAGSYAYRDGMTAHAEVDVRSEPMIVDLLPGLKEFVRTLK